MREEIRFAGAGGQGLVTAALALAVAAARAGLHVVQYQSHGPAARGGASSADVIVSDAPVHHPRADRLSALVALTPAAAEAFSQLSPGGLLLVERGHAAGLPGAVALPFSAALAEAFGHERLMSAAVLGAFLTLRPLVDADAALEAFLEQVPEASRDDNRRAFALGAALARAAKPLPAADDLDL